MDNFLRWIEICSNCGRYVPAVSPYCEICHHQYLVRDLTDDELSIPLDVIVNRINDAYFLFEHFGLGKIKGYESFNFVKYFKLFFAKAQYKSEIIKLSRHYWHLNEQIKDFSNRSAFKNRNYYLNQDFGLDCVAMQEVNETLETQFQKYIDTENFQISRAISIEDLDDDLKRKNTRKVPTPANSRKLITFDSLESSSNVFNALKSYFPGNEVNLLQALQGDIINQPLFFPYKQNLLTELFLRLHENGKLLNSKVRTCEWLCGNFTFRFIRGADDEIRKFNKITVLDLLNKGKGIPPLKLRIHKEEWPPVKKIK
ncbi:hypothetical protein [Mucilaginibacter sp. PAMB04168]|uniref:hypothetical protein n=1 Tax=Mucilaginibacter sp. PAMB04168 TaxID=3138567 RepID=UPI0031F6FDF0